MSKTKGGGSTRNGRDSNAQRLGVKVYDGTKITAGTILIRQRGTKFHPGKNVGQGGDDTLFSMIDGRLSARRIIDLSRLGNFDGTRILADFREAGLIKPMNPEGVRQLQRHSRARSGRSGVVGRVRVAVATLLPLILLASLAVSSGGAPRAPDPGRIEVRSLEALQEAYATRRVRKAIDAYRFVEGAWPPDLQELAIRGFLSESALTPPLARPYYSARRADGVVVLAPEH